MSPDAPRVDPAFVRAFAARMGRDVADAGRLELIGLAVHAVHGILLAPRTRAECALADELDAVDHVTVLDAVRRVADAIADENLARLDAAAEAAEALRRAGSLGAC